MKIKTIALSGLALAILLGAGAQNIKIVRAQEPDNHLTIVQKLVERFGLNQNEVEEIFNQEREARQAEMRAKFEEKLNQFVTDGKITSEQKNQIMAKHEELVQNKNRENWQNLSQEEKRAKGQAMHEELKKWAEENNIDMPFFMMLDKHKNFKQGFKMGHHIGADQP